MTTQRSRVTRAANIEISCEDGLAISGSTVTREAPGAICSPGLKAYASPLPQNGTHAFEFTIERGAGHESRDDNNGYGLLLGLEVSCLPASRRVYFHPYTAKITSDEPGFRGFAVLPNEGGLRGHARGTTVRVQVDMDARTVAFWVVSNGGSIRAGPIDAGITLPAGNVRPFAQLKFAGDSVSLATAASVAMPTAAPAAAPAVAPSAVAPAATSALALVPLPAPGAVGERLSRLWSICAERHEVFRISAALCVRLLNFEAVASSSGGGGGSSDATQDGTRMSLPTIAPHLYRDASSAYEVFRHDLRDALTHDDQSDTWREANVLRLSTRTATATASRTSLEPLLAALHSALQGLNAYDMEQDLHVFDELLARCEARVPAAGEAGAPDATSSEAPSSARTLHEAGAAVRSVLSYEHDAWETLQQLRTREETAFASALVRLQAKVTEVTAGGMLAVGSSSYEPGGAMDAERRAMCDSASALLNHVQQAADRPLDRQLRDALRAARPLLALGGPVAEARTTFEQLRDEATARLREVVPHIERDARMPRARDLQDQLENVQHRQLNPAIRMVGMCRRQLEDSNKALEDENSLHERKRRRLNGGSEDQMAVLRRAITEKEEAVRLRQDELDDAKRLVSTLRARMKSMLEEIKELLSSYPEQSDRLQEVLELALPTLQGLTKRTRGDYTTLREVQVTGKSHVAFHGTIDGRDVFLKRFDVGDEGLRHELRSRESLPLHPAILRPTGYMPETEEGTESVRRPNHLCPCVPDCLLTIS